MMFKEKSTSKLYAFALAAVFALTLAGCGGGTAEMEEEMPAVTDSTPQEMCEDDGGRYNADGSCTPAADLAEEMALSGAQEAAMMAYMMAKGYVESAKDPVAMSNAYKYANMAKEASDAAEMATTSAMAMTHQTAAETARDKAMEAAGERSLGITELANKELNIQDIRNAELEDKDPPKSVKNAQNVGTAMAAAADVAATATTGLTGQSGMSNSTATALVVAEIAATAVVEHKKDGSTFAVGIGASGSPARLLEGETPSRFQTKGDWEAQGLVLPGATANDMLRSHLVISTDIQAATQNYATTASTANTITVGTSAIVGGEVAGDGSNFAATLNSDPTDNNPPVEGQFRCTDPATTPCSISVDGSGKIVAQTGYAFHESTGITRQDGDYLAWGFWMQGSTRSSGPTATNRNAQAGAFAYGSDQFDVKAALAGTATYNGVANGMYSAGGMVEYFDADVSLTANFGGTVGADSTPDTGTVGENDGLLLGAVTGTVTGIRAGGMDVDGSLKLDRAKIIDNNDGPANGGIDQNTAAGTFTGPFTGRRFGHPGGPGDVRRVGRPVLWPQRRERQCGSNPVPHDRGRYFRRGSAGAFR